MWGIGNNKTISTTNIFFHCEHKSMTKILVIRQIFGQRLPKNWPDSEITKKLVVGSPKNWSLVRQKIGQRLPKNWPGSEITKKLVIIRQKIGPTQRLPKNWPDSEITKKLVFHSPKIWSFFRVSILNFHSPKF